MKFLVFIKQVPDVAEIRFDPERKTLIREGVKNVINPYDRRAISEAIRHRNEQGGEVIVATMGPSQARDALLETLLMGADRAIHIQDLRLAGSDTLVTARVLATAAREIGFDLILCGEHSTDSETGQVPPELAELLNVPCAISVRKIEYVDASIRAVCETDEGMVTVRLPIPAVLSTAERLIKPIKLKDVQLSAAPAEKVETLRLDDLDISQSDVGLDGSPTWVATIYEDQIERHPKVEQATDISQAASRIIEMIRKEVIKETLPVVPETFPSSSREFWCLIEQKRVAPASRRQNSADAAGTAALLPIRPVSFEILSAAAMLASKTDGCVSAVVIGERPENNEVLRLSSFGADRVYFANNGHPDQIVALFEERINAQKPFAVFIPATSSGKYLAPRIAARLQLGLTGDCVGFDIDQAGLLVQLKPAFGGNILAPIYSRTFPQFATVRPGALRNFAPRSEREIGVEEWPLPVVPFRYEILAEAVTAGLQAERMESADVIICVGMGLGQENLPLAFRLAELLNAGVGATRRVVDSGWMERQFQVGLTGKFIAPRVYLGLGISGRYNHTIGIRKSHTIVAINNDPNAEIFKIADLGLIGDCVAIAKKMIQTLEG